MLSKLLLALPALIATGQSLAIHSPDGDQARQQVFQKTEDIEALSLEGWQSIQRAAAGVWDAAKDAEEDVASFAADAWKQAKASMDDVEDNVEELSAEAWQNVEGLFGDTVDRTLEIVKPFEDVKEKIEDKVENFPWHRDEGAIDLSKWTIGEILEWTLKHAHDDDKPTLPLHKLAFLVNISTEVQEALSDPKADVTFFAPDDRALTPPSRRDDHHGPPHHLFDNSEEVGDAMAIAEQHPFWKAARQFQREACPHYRQKMAKKALKGGDDDDDDRKEKRRRFFKKLLAVVLTYHVSPGQKTPQSILDSSTVPTALNISEEKNAPAFRIRVGETSILPHVPVKLNFFSSFFTRPIQAKNGVIYIIGESPLLPPLSPLSELFLFPEPFSTLTSAIQKVGLASPLLPHFGNHTVPLSVGDDDEVDERVMVALKDIAEEQHKLTKRSFTVFAPTNRAFRQLGFELNGFLFSPFGGRILKYILAYHVVPDLIFHTDHIDNVTWTQEQDLITGQETNVAWPEELEWLGGDVKGLWDGPHLPPPRKPPHGPTPPGQVNVTHYALPTLLGAEKNTTLHVDVVQYRLRLGHGQLVRRIVVKPSPYGPKRGPKGPIKPIGATIADGTAWGGAVHVIPQLIAPPLPHGHHDHDHGDHGDALTRLVRRGRYAVPNLA